MGVTDTKAITKHIDQQYKSIRKYHDPIYGEITLLEQKDTKKMYALVQKVIVDQGQVVKIRSILQKRKYYPQFLVQLHQHYSCKIDYCSNLEKYYLLLQYDNHTLYNQMTLRLENNNPFRLQELLNILNSYIEILTLLKQQGQRFNHIASNQKMIYSANTGGLKTIQQIMKCDEQQRFANDNFYPTKKSHLQEYFVYHSPQVFSLYCNKQTFYAKTLSRQQSSVIFTLGMNFIECALLADLSGVYDFKERKINFDKLNIVIFKLIQIYGSEIGEMIGQMLNQSPSDRPTISQLKNFNKTFPKRRKITIPKHTKIQQIKLMQQLHAN